MRNARLLSLEPLAAETMFPVGVRKEQKESVCNIGQRFRIGCFYNVV